MKSLVRRLWTAQSITAAGTVSSNVKPQRIRDENGALQVTLNQNPSASADAELWLEGRMSEGEAYGTLLEIKLNHADFAASPFSRIFTGLQILPDMRIATRNGGGGYTVAGGTTATVDLME